MPHLDIRNLDKKTSFKFLWMQDHIKKIRLKFTKEVLSDTEIKNYLLKVYDKRYQPTGRFYNSITKQNTMMKLEQFINRFLNSNDILSGYCCTFENHDTINIAANALKYILDQRKFYKNKMEAAERGSDDYIYYKILQLTFKILANSYYGITGLATSPFFLPEIQNSTTFSGQDIITTSIIAMESFLGNNCKFEDLDDCIDFINNVISDSYKHSLSDYVDVNIDKTTLLDYLVSRIKNKKDNHKEHLDEILTNILNTYGEEMFNRIYYKNQIVKLLLNNSKMKEDVLNRVKDGYKNDKEYAEMLCDFTFYDHILEDRFKRANKQTRNSVIVVDTDSNFLYLDNQIQATIEALDLPKNDVTELEVMNLFIDVSTEALRRIFWTFTTNLGIENDYKSIINMKNEFVYSKLLTTKNKKHYAGLLLAELGKKINKPAEARMDIKGLPIRKSVVPKPLREAFTEYLLNDILVPETISMKNIVSKYDHIVQSVKNSLERGEVDYLIPAKVEIVENYKFPERIQQVRGMIAWNALEPDNVIIPPENINIIKLKTGIYTPRIVGKKNQPDESLKDYWKRLEEFLLQTSEYKFLKENYPEKFEIIMKVIYGKGKKSGLDFADKGFAVIAIPKETQIPDYIIPLIDFGTMVESNTAAGTTLIGSLGIYCTKGKKKSNIIKL